MSYSEATCPNCGERYIHLFVGSQLLSGHHCPLAAPDVSFQPTSTEVHSSQPASS